ncbi:hypothetical protein D1345_22805 [Chromobacterium rhizoryzae]|uniref:Uncharacterized protein n=1 Tax=Chromobacterium rhizoryzae TaxID=1778675 RepID=A0AAD0W9X9_9NEIS|nr:hypothetical protein D1345_22805 [Chromobacterium rhizoryzae]
MFAAPQQYGIETPMRRVRTQQHPTRGIMNKFYWAKTTLRAIGAADGQPGTCPRNQLASQTVPAM